MRPIYSRTTLLALCGALACGHPAPMQDPLGAGGGAPSGGGGGAAAGGAAAGGSNSGGGGGLGGGGAGGGTVDGCDALCGHLTACGLSSDDCAQLCASAGAGCKTCLTAAACEDLGSCDSTCSGGSGGGTAGSSGAGGGTAGGAPVADLRGWTIEASGLATTASLAATERLLLADPARPGRLVLLGVGLGDLTTTIAMEWFNGVGQQLPYLWGHTGHVFTNGSGFRSDGTFIGPLAALQGFDAQVGRFGSTPGPAIGTWVAPPIGGFGSLPRGLVIGDAGQVYVRTERHLWQVPAPGTTAWTSLSLPGPVGDLVVLTGGSTLMLSGSLSRCTFPATGCTALALAGLPMPPQLREVYPVTPDGSSLFLVANGATGVQLYFSSDSGATVTQVPLPGATTRVRWSPASPSVVVAIGGTAAPDRLSTSRDRGVTWSTPALADEVIAGQRRSAVVTDAVVDSAGRLYWLSNSRIYSRPLGP